MSGYLEVKLIPKGFTPWKTWKEQWCILRPSPPTESGVIIAFHTSAGMSATSSILLPSESVVFRTDSRSRKYSFGIFPVNDFRKPFVFLCGQSESSSQVWMAKIRTHLGGQKTKDFDSSGESFVISLVDNEFSRKLHLQGLYGALHIESFGIVIIDESPKHKKISITWEELQTICILENVENSADSNKICVLSTNSCFLGGEGKVYLFSSSAVRLAESANSAKREYSQKFFRRLLDKRLSKSEGNLFPPMFKSSCIKAETGVSISSKENVKWYVGMSDCVPVDQSSFEKDSYKTKVATTLINAAIVLSSPGSQMDTIGSLDSRTSLSSETDRIGPLNSFPHTGTKVFDRRCSGASIASGIYEEISEDLPLTLHKNLKSTNKDNMYEALKEVKSVSNEVHVAFGQPPPLPPRFAIRGRYDSMSDSGLEDGSWCSTPPSHDSAELPWNAINSSTGSLPRSYTNPSSVKSFKSSQLFDHDKVKGKASTFNVFRKRIKSDSRVVVGKEPVSTSTYSNAVQGATCLTVPRKKKFEFNVTPSKPIDLIKNSRVGKVFLKNTRSSSSSLKSDVVKSCEFLNLNDRDEVDNAVDHRCSRSVEHLEAGSEGVYSKSDDLDKVECNKGLDLSLLHSDIADNSFPSDIIDLILKDDIRGIRLKQKCLMLPPENDYLPMSPKTIVTGHIEEQYVVMSSPKIAISDHNPLTKAS